MSQVRSFAWRPADVPLPKTSYWTGALFLFAIWDFVSNGEINPVIGALLLGALLAVGLGFLFPKIRSQNKLRIAVLPLAIVFTMAAIFENREILRAVWLLSALLWWGMILLSILLIRGRIELTSVSLIIRTVMAPRNRVSRYRLGGVNDPAHSRCEGRCHSESGRRQGEPLRI